MGIALRTFVGLRHDGRFERQRFGELDSVTVDLRGEHTKDHEAEMQTAMAQRFAIAPFRISGFAPEARNVGLFAFE